MESSSAGEESKTSSPQVTSTTNRTKETDRVITWIPHTESSETTRRAIRSNAARLSAHLRLDTMIRRRQSEPQSASASSDDVPNVGTTSESGTRRRRTKRQGLSGHALFPREINVHEPLLQSSTLATRQSQPSTFLLNHTLSFRADSRQLSEAICSSSALSQSLILLIKTTWIYNPEQGPVRDPTCPVVFLVKDLALRAMKGTLDVQPSDTGPIAAAAALLATWEMKYGSEEESEVHVDAWRRLLGASSSDMPDTNFQSQVTTLADRVLHAARHHSQMVAASKVQPIYGYMSTTLNSRFRIFRPFDARFTGIFAALDQLANFNVRAENALQKLREINLAVFMAVVPENVADRAMRYCLHQVHNATCALCARLSADVGMFAHLGSTTTSANILQLHMSKIRLLGLRDFEILIGTAFQEASFWALWISSTCLNSWDGKTIQVLKQFQESLGIRSWNDTIVTLGRYAYHEAQLGCPSQALFLDIVADSSNTDY